MEWPDAVIPGPQADHHTDGAALCEQWGCILWITHGRLPFSSAATNRAYGGACRRARSHDRPNPRPRANCFPICPVCTPCWDVSPAQKHLCSEMYLNGGNRFCNCTNSWPFSVHSGGCRSPTGTERKQLERSPLNRRKMQEKGSTATHSPAPQIAINSAETKTKGSDYKPL